MNRTINCVCAIAIAAGTAQAVEAQSNYYQGELTSAVKDYNSELDQSMSGNWSGGDDGCCNDGCCDDDGCNSGCNNGCGDSSCACCCDPGCFSDNIEMFMGGDGWANHADDDDANNFGYRLGANSGFGGDNIRFQVGGSYGFYNLHGREDEPNDVASERQLFLTGGIYKRSNVCCGDRWSWGVVYDYMNANNWGEDGDTIDLSQIRGRFGYALSKSNELGMWAAIGLDTDTTPLLSSSVRVQAKDQINIYWQHQFEYGAETMFYVGLADEPNGINPVLDSPNLREVVLGVRGRAPMNRWLALYGNVHYILPGTTGGDSAPNGVQNSYAEEVWNVSVGLVFYPGAKARSRSVSGPAGLPLIPVADNGTFAVNTPAGAL